MTDSTQQTLLLVGDVMIGRLFNNAFERGTPLDLIWGDTLPLLQSADAVICNLETTLTKEHRKYPKTFNYKLHPKYAKTLQIANIKFCSLANNHILDFYREGMFETKKTLRKLGIAFAGVGNNLKQAQQPAFIDIGIKVGFLSAADHYHSWRAAPHIEGIWYIPLIGNNFQTPEWQQALEIVRETRKKCDLLVFSLHWGANYVDEIPREFKEFGYALIDAGVDIIHGHSAHHVLGMEQYKHGYIFYSLGDFIDDYAVDPYYRNDLAFIAEITVKDTQAVRVKLHPTAIKNMQVNLTNDPQHLHHILVARGTR